ncbi:SDR family NAD(P)-dependent oxidoreductase [Streptomyces shaanxiensis]|uniref:SDR family NAD(P)-dependent oxidoreductase n=1 Tax=Streptomyces shaanxiensis TaxID=653357 RepID=UPI003CD05A63
MVNVASMAAYQPNPRMALYRATKAFVLSLTEALWEESRGTGLRVLAGPVSRCHPDRVLPRRGHHAGRRRGRARLAAEGACRRRERCRHEGGGDAIGIGSTTLSCMSLGSPAERRTAAQSGGGERWSRIAGCRARSVSSNLRERRAVLPDVEVGAGTLPTRRPTGKDDLSSA